MPGGSLLTSRRLEQSPLWSSPHKTNGLIPTRSWQHQHMMNSSFESADSMTNDIDGLWVNPSRFSSSHLPMPPPTGESTELPTTKVSPNKETGPAGSPAGKTENGEISQPINMPVPPPSRIRPLLPSDDDMEEVSVDSDRDGMLDLLERVLAKESIDEVRIPR